MAESKLTIDERHSGDVTILDACSRAGRPLTDEVDGFGRRSLTQRADHGPLIRPIVPPGA